MILAPERFFLLHFYFLSIIELHKKLGIPNSRIDMTAKMETDAVIAILLCFCAGQMIFLLLPMGVQDSVIH